MAIGRLATFDSSSVTWPWKPGIDEAGGRVDEEPEPPEGGLALEASNDVIGQAHDLEGRSEHELAGVEDERIGLSGRR